jgi:hypothetical protein
MFVHIFSNIQACDFRLLAFGDSSQPLKSDKSSIVVSCKKLISEKIASISTANYHLGD